MDSNSGSMQSSSGGDEEYDSRTEMISPFLQPFGSASNHPQPPPPPLSHYQGDPPTLFEPPPHNLGPFPHSTTNPDMNSLYNLDLVWSRGLNSEPNYLGNLTGLSSSSAPLSSSTTQSLLGGHGPGQGPFPSSSAAPLQSGDGDGGRAPARSDQTAGVKTSRKRSRASRRAPTTVLTTDTSNFRQMVQEFTGIPAPPFSAAASPFSRRLDLFAAGSALRSGHLDPLGGPLYPFRPAAQKVQTSPFVSSSSSQSLLNSAMIESMAPASNIGNTTNTTITTSSSYQLPSDLGLLPKENQTMVSMQNPVLTFQSLLQSPLKYPASKSQGSSQIPSLHELGMSHEQVDASLGAQAEHLGGSFGGNNGGDSQNGSYKLNCSASTSDFRPDRGLDSSRNDSWVCPSD